MRVSLLSFLLLFASGTSLHSQTFTWRGGDQANPNSWNLSSNWSLSTGTGPSPQNNVPASGNVVVFDGVHNTTSDTITMSSNGAGGVLQFTSGARSYTIGSISNSIELSLQSNLVANQALSSTTQTINARIDIGDGSLTRTISNSAGGAINFAGGLRNLGTDARTVNVTGSGTVDFGSVSVESGGSLNIVNNSSGLVRFNGSNAAALTVGASSDSRIFGVQSGAVSQTGGNLTVFSGTVGSNVVKGDVTGVINTTGGNLIVNGDASNVNVSGTGVLSGTGSIDLAVIGNGGKHNPGLSPGLQTITNLTYQSGSTFTWELSGAGNVRGVDFDAINSTILDVDANATFQMSISSALQNDLTFWASSRSWEVFSGLTGASLLETSNFQISTPISTQLGTFSWSGGTLNFSAVPEPSSMALLGLISTVGFGVARFRRKKTAL